MPLKTHYDEQPTLNLTAMLDVAFLLIIFFALNTKFLDEERQIELCLPKVVDRGALSPTVERKLVSVYRDGTIALDQTPVSLNELTARLAAIRNRAGHLGILVRGDAKGEFQHVAAVLNACKQAGVADLGISVRLEEGKVTR
jgi:biopolymer transport protein ExbD